MSQFRSVIGLSKHPANKVANAPNLVKLEIIVSRMGRMRRANP
jgi:hypothetical protein